MIKIFFGIRRRGRPLAGKPGPPHIDSPPAEGHTLGHQPLALTSALCQGAVGADDAPPGQAGLVALEEDGAGKARRSRGDVAVGADDAGRDLAHPVEDFERARVSGLGQLAGPKAAMMRFWYSESSSGEMK